MAATMLSGASGQTRGAPGLIASSGSTTDGNTSYSTSIASAALCASTRQDATTAATGSPAKRTMSCASSRRGGTVIGEPSGRWNTASVGIVPTSSLIRSAPVNTAATPFISAAALVSIAL